MLTPAFDLSQDKDFLTILIKAPFAKISDTEIFIEDTDFKFFSKPYFLRLTLPGNIVEDGREKADYDVDKGTFTICIPKQTPGEHFEGLDMITKLLAPKGSASAAAPLIQVVDDKPSEEDEGACIKENTADKTVEGEEGEEEEYDWSIPQTPYKEEPHQLGAPSYGFANQKSGVFKRIQEELCGTVDCPDPDCLPLGERKGRRHLVEQAKFDEDYYLSDLVEDDMIQPLIQFKPPWIFELKKLDRGLDPQLTVELTDDEKDQMRKLPKKEYLLDPKEETTVWFGLVDIIFAYAYNCRSTMGENTVESGWTISKLSATLSWLEAFSTLQEVLVCCVRRSLCYPLYRHWGLTSAVLQDVACIFKLGRRRLLKCLLEVHSILKDQDSRYILNDLYITDYCVWIQEASSKKIQSLADTLSKTHVSKEEVDLGIVEAEKLLSLVDNVDSLAAGMSSVDVNDKTQSETDTDSSDECTEDDNTDSDDIVTEDDEVIKNIESTSSDNVPGNVVNSKNVEECTKNVDASKCAESVETKHIDHEAESEKITEDLGTLTIEETLSSQLKSESDQTSKPPCKPLITVIE